MRFWDSSAIVPLLVEESTRRTLLDLLQEDPVMLVWWGTPGECVSALARREREDNLTVQQTSQAIERLHLLSNSWEEILPSEQVGGTSLRLLRVHQLRAADSLQLAAAVTAAEHEPATLEFLSLDERLQIAAQREGFRLTSI